MTAQLTCTVCQCITEYFVILNDKTQGQNTDHCNMREGRVFEYALI